MRFFLWIFPGCTIPEKSTCGEDQRDLCFYTVKIHLRGKPLIFVLTHGKNPLAGKATDICAYTQQKSTCGEKHRDLFVYAAKYTCGENQRDLFAWSAESVQNRSVGGSCSVLSEITRKNIHSQRSYNGGSFLIQLV